jgi:hypothetical protein
MGRALARLGTRLGTPKPAVLCPRPRDARLLRLAEIRVLEERASAAEPVLYDDAVDIHLNPKIGRDWMDGHQRRVVTPGKKSEVLSHPLRRQRRDGSLAILDIRAR